MFKHSAIDSKKNDKRCSDVERHAEDAFQGHVHVTDQTIESVALMGPRRWQPSAEPGVSQENQCHDRENQAGCAACGFEHEHDRERAKNLILKIRQCSSVDEFLEIPQ